MIDFAQPLALRFCMTCGHSLAPWNAHSGCLVATAYSDPNWPGEIDAATIEQANAEFTMAVIGDSEE
jgi:hypothetical protein